MVVVTETTVPGGEYFTAFDKRLSSTAPAATRSVSTRSCILPGGVIPSVRHARARASSATHAFMRRSDNCAGFAAPENHPHTPESIQDTCLFAYGVLPY